jgi:cytochrome P450
MSSDEMLAKKDEFFGHNVVRDPYPKLAERAAECPVHPGTFSSFFDMVGAEDILFPDAEQISVLSFDGVDAGFKDQEHFSSCWYEASLGKMIGRTIIEMDPPEHGRHRQLIQGALTKREMHRWEEEFVRAIVDTTIDTFIESGTADLVDDFALHYPLKVIAAACGLPQEDVSSFYRWAAILTNVSISAEEREEASAEFGEYLAAAVTDRRTNPRSDLVTHLVQAEFRDDAGRQALDDDEVIAFLRLLLPAAAQTTYRTLCNLLFGLLSHPEQLQALRDDHSLIEQAIEEGLRWQPPLMSFGRTTVADAEIEGVAVPAGTLVNLVVGIANRDPQRWDNPDVFDIYREPQGHLAFGSGAHVCLGIHFARMELRVAMEQVLTRLEDLQFEPGIEPVHIGGLGQRSPAHLPVTFTPATPIGTAP